MFARSDRLKLPILMLVDRHDDLGDSKFDRSRSPNSPNWQFLQIDFWFGGTYYTILLSKDL